MGDFHAQELIDAAEPFATATQADAQLFIALEKAVVQLLGDFDMESLAKAAWAFATVGQTDVVLFELSARAAE